MLKLGTGTIAGARLGGQTISGIRLGASLIWSAANIPDPLALTPPEDTPTFTAEARGASAAPAITGSAGWFREKRVGVAETQAGEAQTSTAAPDLTGSTRFYYPCVPAGEATGGNPGNYVTTVYKNGSTASQQNARWLFNVSFTTSSPVVELRLRAQRASPLLGMVMVNGRRVSEAPTPTGFTTTGAGYAATMTFPDSRPRTITIYGLNSTEGSFGGVAVAPKYTITKPSGTATRRVAIIGDSYVNGSTGVTATETFAWRLALRMGADEILQAGIGGTGWTKALQDLPDSVFQGRISAVMSMRPHVVIFAGGRNDAATGLQAAVEQSLDSVGDKVSRFVLPTASESGQAPVRQAIAAGCSSRGVPFLDAPVDVLPKISDNVHPTLAGHQQFADSIRAMIA